MGACRGLNLLLGMSQAADLGGPWGWIAAGSLALFVVGVTWISRSEAAGGRSAGPVAGLVLQDLALVGLVAVAFHAERFPAHSSGDGPVAGLIALLMVAAVVNRASIGATLDPTPARYQNAVKTGVLSLVWLDVGLVATVAGVGPALGVAALWVPAFVLGRWLYST